MKTFFVNFYKRLGYIKEILFAKSFVLLVHHERPKPRNRLHSNIGHYPTISSILKDAGTHIEQAGQSTDSLINTLGIKRADGNTKPPGGKAVGRSAINCSISGDIGSKLQQTPSMATKKKILAYLPGPWTLIISLGVAVGIAEAYGLINWLIQFYK